MCGNRDGRHCSRRRHRMGGGLCSPEWKLSRRRPQILGVSTPIADPFCYRDPRTGAAMEALHAKIPAERLYALTGIQVLPLNTLYQLYADGIAGIPANLPWLNLPEYLLYRWGAKPVAEYTNATHTSMVSLGKQQWSQEIFDAAGLDISAAPEIVPPGSIVGRLQGPLAELACSAKHAC